MQALRVNQTKPTSRNAFNVDLFALQSGSISFGTPHRLLTYLLTLSLRITSFGVLFLAKKTKFIIFYTKFHLKPVKFLPSKYTTVNSGHLHL